MFDSVLNYAPATYEAIILAFVVLGLIQVLVLRNKSRQVEQLKSAFAALSKSAASAIAHVVRSSVTHIARLSAENVRLAHEVADWQRQAMEAAADRDEALEELNALRAAHNDVFERHVSGEPNHPADIDPSELFERIFGGSGLGSRVIFEGNPGQDGGYFADRFADFNPNARGVKIGGELVASFTLDKDGKLTPLDDKSFEFVNDTGIHGGTFNREPGAPDLSIGDLLAGIRAVAARRRLDRHPLADLVFPTPGRFASALRDPGEPPHPVFDNDESTKASLTPARDENCDTQRGSDYEPRSYPSSSPRAG